MKKNLLTFGLVLAFSLSAYLSSAQIGKGANLLGGSISFTSQTNKFGTAAQEQTNKYFFVSPSWGKALRQNLVVGADVAYGNDKVKASDSKKNMYGAGVFARKYHNFGASGFYFFAQARLGTQFSHATGRYNPDNSSHDAKEKMTNISLGLQPGISYALTPRLHLETGLNNLLYVGYSNLEVKAGSTIVQRQKSFSAGVSLANDLQWNMGFRFLLGGS